MGKREVSACQEKCRSRRLWVTSCYRNQVYSSSFRVANYIKPHFEIGLALEQKRVSKLAKRSSGKLQLLYPDGEP